MAKICKLFLSLSFLFFSASTFVQAKSGDSIVYLGTASGDGDIKLSGTLSSSFYSTERVFKDVIDNIFMHCWHLVTDDTMFIEPDYVYPFILMDNVLPEPLFLIRNNSGI